MRIHSKIRDKFRASKHIADWGTLSKPLNFLWLVYLTFQIIKKDIIKTLVGNPSEYSTRNGIKSLSTRISVLRQ